MVLKELVSLGNMALESPTSEHKQGLFSAQLKNILNLYPDKLATPIQLYFHSGHPALLPAIAKVIGWRQFSDLSINFAFRFDYVSAGFARRTADQHHAEILFSIGNDLERYDFDQSISLYADSRRVINTYRRYFKREIDLNTDTPIARH